MLIHKDLDDADFRNVVKNTPLVSIDLVIADPTECILMGWRENEPAKGTWFVPGGRIRKDERIAEAFARIIKTETGMVRKLSDAKFAGIYEHLYPTNCFAEPGFGTHYCVLAYLLRVDERPAITMDRQHTKMEWLPRGSGDVHPYSQAYFELLK